MSIDFSLDTLKYVLLLFTFSVPNPEATEVLVENMVLELALVR